jgi:hypothetical protein
MIYIPYIYKAAARGLHFYVRTPPPPCTERHKHTHTHTHTHTRLARQEVCYGPRISNVGDYILVP